MNTILVTLTQHGLTVGQDGLCLTMKGTTPMELWELVQELAATPAPDPIDLAANVRVKIRDKYDRYLSDDLLNLAYAARALDVPAAWKVLGELANLTPPSEP